MHKLDSIQKAVLEDLFQDSYGEEGVDPLAFRATHFDQIEQIEYLENTGFIRKENERYFSSLTALVQLDSDRARRLLEIAELVFAELKVHYRKTQREPLAVAALAERLGLGLADVCESLSYMIEGPSWCGGYSGSFTKSKDPSIQPAEQILRFGLFINVIQQLESWQDERIRDRQLALAGAFRAFPVESASTQPIKFAVRMKPDWFEELPQSSQLLLDEVYCAWSHGLRALTAMGIRAVIDDVCLDLVGDIGSFKKKLEALKLKGCLSDIEQTVLSAAIDVGSASAHRGHAPHESDITTLFDITERLLHGQYVLPKAAERMKSNTPARGGRHG